MTYDEQVREAIKRLMDILNAKGQPAVLAVFDRMPEVGMPVDVHFHGTCDTQTCKGLLLIAAAGYSGPVSDVLRAALTDVGWALPDDPEDDGNGKVH